MPLIVLHLKMSVCGGTTIFLKRTRDVPSNSVNISKISVVHTEPLRVACHGNIMSLRSQDSNIKNKDAKCLNEMSCNSKKA